MGDSPPQSGARPGRRALACPRRAMAGGGGGCERYHAKMHTCLRRGRSAAVRRIWPPHLVHLRGCSSGPHRHLEDTLLFVYRPHLSEGLISGLGKHGHSIQQVLLSARECFQVLLHQAPAIPVQGFPPVHSRQILHHVVGDKPQAPEIPDPESVRIRIPSQAHLLRPASHQELLPGHIAHVEPDVVLLDCQIIQVRVYEPPATGVCIPVVCKFVGTGAIEAGLSEVRGKPNAMTSGDALVAGHGTEQPHNDSSQPIAFRVAEAGSEVGRPVRRFGPAYPQRDGC